MNTAPDPCRRWAALLQAIILLFFILLFGAVFVSFRDVALNHMGIRAYQAFENLIAALGGVQGAVTLFRWRVLNAPET